MIKIKSNKMRWTISGFLALLILFGTFHSVFSIIAFLSVCLLFFTCDRESILLQLFFIMPMANIFKLSPSSQSFFTIVLLLYVVMYFVLPRKATLLIVLFVVYIIVGQLISGSFLLFRTVKLICNVLFLSSILNKKVKLHHKKIFFSYIIGNIVASCFGMMDSGFFKIKDYVGEQVVGGVEFIGLTRFTGLYTDPNYYTVGMIISLTLLVVLYHRKEIPSFLVVGLGIPIVYFLLQTYSKSAVLLLFLPLMFLTYSLIEQRKIFSLSTILVCAIIFVIMALSGKIEALNIVISRFNVSDTSEGTDLNSLTTGRFDIWVLYFKYMVNHFVTFFVGAGISAPIIEGHAAHNTYFDLWYFLGIFGTGLLLLILDEILIQSKLMNFRKNILNYSVLICVMILYFFLSELFYFDLPFHIFLSVAVLNLSNKNNVELLNNRF